MINCIRNYDKAAFCPLKKSKSVLGCLSTEPVSSDAVNRNRKLEDTHYRSINFAGGSGEGMSVETTETKSEIHNTGFKVMALDIFSLMLHLDELRIFLNEQRPHIIGITETKIDSTTDNSHIEIDDYVVERNDRNRHGGGVAMYIHKSVNYRIREDLSNSDIESISTLVKVCNYKPFIVTSIYMPPGIPVDYFNELDNLFHFIDAEDKETIFLGDTNCDILDSINNATKGYGH